jgi:hypothetical protein
MPYQLPNGSVYPADLLRERAQEAAQRRREYRQATRGGRHTLAELLTLAEEDSTLARTRIKTVLSWLPGIGVAKIRRILEETHLSPSQRLSSITGEKRQQLIEHPRIRQHTAAVIHQRVTGGAA